MDATVSLNGRVSFLYVSAAWTLTETLAKKIDGFFTRLLRSALGFTWKDHVSNKELYAEVPKATENPHFF